MLSKRKRPASLPGALPAAPSPLLSISEIGWSAPLWPDRITRPGAGPCSVSHAPSAVRRRNTAEMKVSESNALPAPAVKSDVEPPWGRIPISSRLEAASCASMR